VLLLTYPESFFLLERMHVSIWRVQLSRCEYNDSPKQLINQESLPEGGTASFSPPGLPEAYANKLTRPGILLLFFFLFNY